MISYPSFKAKSKATGDPNYFTCYPNDPNRKTSNQQYHPQPKVPIVLMKK